MLASAYRLVPSRFRCVRGKANLTTPEDPDLVELGRSVDYQTLSQQLWHGSLLGLERWRLGTALAGHMVIHGTREGTSEVALVPWIRGVHSRVLGGGARDVQVLWGRSCRLHSWHQHDSWPDNALLPPRARRAGFSNMVSNRLVDCRRYRSRRSHPYFRTITGGITGARGQSSNFRGAEGQPLF